MEQVPVTTVTPEISAAIRQAFTDNMDKEYSLIYVSYCINKVYGLKSSAWEKKSNLITTN